MNQDQENDEDKEIDINVPRLPDVPREHGKHFKKPARWVIDWGCGEYLLFSKDYILLGGVWNCF